jgi:HSP20 family protein
MDIQEEMNRLFNTVRTRDSEGSDMVWGPSVDISESEDEIVVVAEVPGMKKEDIHITIQDNVLTLKGEKKREIEEKEENYHRLERSFGSFERSFSLPSIIQAGQVKAGYKDGVLTITLPKAEEAKPKQIDIAVK